MRICVVGAGPAGLYASILLARQGHDVRVLERNRERDAFGFGLVLPPGALALLGVSDAPTHEAARRATVRWSDIEVHHRGERLRVGGNEFFSLARARLLQLLYERARELGVDLRFGVSVDDVEELRLEHDLLVGADGLNSAVRRRYERALRPRMRYGANRFIWLGTRHLFDALTFLVRRGEHGPLAVHAYPYDARTSTFIAECHVSTLERTGFERAPVARTRRTLEQLFGDELGGAGLIGDWARWLAFPRLTVERWWCDNVVLLGDALHSAHFSIGCGTMLALSDAVALAGAVARDPDPGAALRRFEREQRPRVEAYQQAAERSMCWFEQLGRHVELEPLPFAHALLTRTGRVTDDRLAASVPEFFSAWQRWRERHGPASDAGAS